MQRPQFTLYYISSNTDATASVYIYISSNTDATASVYKIQQASEH